MYGYLSCIETIIQLQNRSSSARNGTCKILSSVKYTHLVHIFFWSVQSTPVTNLGHFLNQITVSWISKEEKEEKNKAKQNPSLLFCMKFLVFLQTTI